MARRTTRSRCRRVINIPVGGKALLRFSDLNVTEYHTLASLGIRMHVVGYNARLLRDQDGNNTDYYTNSITLGGGESIDVILDASDTTLYPANSKFYLYTPQLDHLSNDAENFGGMMTEVHILSCTPAISMPTAKKCTTRRAAMRNNTIDALSGSCAALRWRSPRCSPAAAQAAAPGITGHRHRAHVFDLTAATAATSRSPTARAFTPGATAATPRPIEPVRAGHDRRRLLSRRAACSCPGPTLVVQPGRDGHGHAAQQPAGGGGQHLDPVSGFHDAASSATGNGAPGGTDAGSRAWRHGHVHLRGRYRRHALLLQRHAGRPAGRDGPVRCADRAASTRHASGAVPPNGAMPPLGSARAVLGLPDTCFAHGRHTASLPNSGDFRLAAAAFNHPAACYDREYLFQFSEMDPAHPSPGEAQCSRQPDWPAAADRLPARADRAVPPGVFHDQRPLDARRHGPELRAASTRTSPTTAIRTCTRAS